jgi:hypothetical protein
MGVPFTSYLEFKQAFEFSVRASAQRRNHPIGWAFSWQLHPSPVILWPQTNV